MYPNSIKYSLQFILLFALQVIIFNNINFLGYANPYIYILFILLLPVKTNRYLLLTLAFTLGVLIDFYENTGGVNAFATVFIAYLRNPLINILSNDRSLDSEEKRLINFSKMQWFLYLSILIILHHFLVDFIEGFRPELFLTIVNRSLVGALITFIFAIMYLLLFPLKRENEF